jgi:hypothetical protein
MSTGAGTQLGLPCEPTRICEGYTLGVCRAPDALRTAPTARDLIGDTLLGHVYNRVLELQRILQLAPEGPTQDSTPTPGQLYAACCRFLAAVSGFFTGHHTTRCELVDEVNTLTCPQPGQGQSAEVYWGQASSVVETARVAIESYLLECLCNELLPPCPVDPGDDRLILGQVCVSNGQITDICNWKGRRIVVTWPTVLWWLSSLPVVPVLGRVIERLCCGEYGRGFTHQILASGALLDRTYATDPADEQALLGQLASLAGALWGSISKTGGK